MSTQKKSKMRHTGYTMIELIMVIGLIGLIGLLATYISFGNFRLFRNQDTEIEISSQNRLVLDEVLNSVREAVSVESSFNDGTTTYTTDNDSIVLKFHSVDLDHNIIDNEYDRIIYWLDNTDTLKRAISPSVSSSRLASSKPVSVIVDTINFSYDSADFNEISYVTVTLTTSKNQLGQTKNITVSGEAQLRNF